MIRVTKPKGFANIQLEDVPTPAPDPDQVLARTDVTLISRGSELFARYIKDDAVSPSIMGYSLAGVVETVGRDARAYTPGDRVMIVAPHASHAIGTPHPTDGRMAALPDGVSQEEATFVPLVTSAIAWADSSDAQADDTVVILGQGLVGSLMLQVMRSRGVGRVIAVDALDMRCEMAREFGADVVINARDTDPVAAVREATGGEGAALVIDCVGGHAGVQSFEQAQDMVRPRGTLQLIALYQQAPLALHSGKIMNRRLVAGILPDEPRSHTVARALSLMASGDVHVAPMITHRLPHTDAKAAFDLLWDRPGDALGVLLEWGAAEDGAP
ncbi:zinc-binding dehydrogenase [Candidatus Poribacteria bacterium]|nr:zinc-binding dehydrogenase [Candidatus Poribacteria bacterium]